MSLEALSNLASLQAPFVFEQQNDDQNNPTPNDVTNENILTRQDSVPALPQLTRQTSLSGAPRYVRHCNIL